MSGQPITCVNTKKQLASIDNDAIYLYCKLCHVEHSFSKAQILEMWGMNPQQREAPKFPNYEKKHTVYAERV
jgi:hypothetical protein